jgi:hypothetical protein
VNWLHLVATVRCLACGTVYPKPWAVGTAESNPGCPRCSYVGWVPVEEDQADDVTEGPGPLRFDVDLPLRRIWRAS